MSTSLLPISVVFHPCAQFKGNAKGLISSVSNVSSTVAAPLCLRSTEWGHIPGKKLRPSLRRSKAALKFQWHCGFSWLGAVILDSICGVFRTLYWGRIVSVAGYPGA